MSGVLLLNASNKILTIVGVRRALTLIVTNNAEVIEERKGRNPARTTGGDEIPYPSVVRLLREVAWDVKSNSKTPPLTRKRIFTRDGFVCQVVGCDSTDVTLDHVFPKSQGGQNTWENLVSMCARHNHAKGASSLEQMGWELKSVPSAPVGYMLNASSLRPEWEPYLENNADQVMA